MSTEINEKVPEDFFDRRALVARLIAALVSAGLVLLSRHWLSGWGFLIAILVGMLAIEHVRRTSGLTSLVRVGMAVGLLAGWLVHRFL